jgi:hypothetical protein
VQTNHTDGDWVYGRSKQTYAFQPTTPGPLTLPRVRVDWWDSVNHRQQSAVLPARQVVVAAGGDSLATGAAPTTDATRPSAAPAPANRKPLRAPTPATAADEPAADTPGRSAPPLYLWLAAGAVLLVLLVAVRPARSTPRRPVPAPADATANSSAPPQRSAIRPLRRRLHDACSRNDPQAAARALLDWSAAVWPDRPPRTLGALARQVARGGELIGELEDVLYNAQHRPWSGAPLWQALATGLQATPADNTATPPPGAAPPLYPDWSRRTG